MRDLRRVAAVVGGFGVLLVAAPVSAGNEAGVTYYQDVLPIMQSNCQTCHRPSGQNISGLIAPMSFMTYQETRPWARAIASKVAACEKQVHRFIPRQIAPPEPQKRDPHDKRRRNQGEQPPV